MAWCTRRLAPALLTCAALVVACGGNGGGAADEGFSPTNTPTDAAPGTTQDTSTGVPTTGHAGGETTHTDAQTTTGQTTADVTTSGATVDSTGTTTGEPPCPAGEIECVDGTARVCDGSGGHSSETPCAMACADGLGCVACEPGAHQCVDELSQVCPPDGSGWIDHQTCDPVQGLHCDAGTGTCLGACADVDTSYIGCDYYPVITQQYDPHVGVANPFAVAVANTTGETAQIKITRGADTVATAMVPASSVKVIKLPWIPELALGPGPSVLLADGAYRLRSTRPVTIYQYNPLNAGVTNDASLLLPVNTWTGNVLVAAWQHFDAGKLRGFYSVTASQDDTTVTLKPPKGGTPVQAGGGVDDQGNGVVVLDAGDVLQVLTAPGGDLTGSIITADRPVQVVGGHECSNVPLDVDACDHLEESMFPIEALAKEYFVVPPVQVPDTSAEKAVIVRVIASEANTTLTFDPDQPVEKLLVNAGDFVELPPSTARFVVKADRKILVAEYMVGQGGGSGTSDPAMLLAVPSEQYRSSYLFYAQTGWMANYVDIIAPANSNVTVDGTAVAGFVPIGATGFSLAHVELWNGDGGSHTVVGDQKLGISVYGVVDNGSYWYPGGLDLDLIPQ